MTSEAVIAVISYNNAAATINCVRSLERQTVKGLRIVVWDNASPDGAGEILAAAEFGENTTVVSSETNLLWAPAVNRALAGATEPYVGFCNNDLQFTSRDAIELLIELLESKPRAGAAVPMGYGIGGGQDFPTYKERALAAGTPESDFRASGPKRLTYFVGAAVLMRREAWEAVGQLDETMPLGADDFDYSLRLNHDGYEIWTDPAVVVNHAGHATKDTSEWTEWGPSSWASFDRKWSGYCVDSEEWDRCLWNGFWSGVTGSGWSPDEYDRRIR